jgi:GGDEF domain-containing protein
MVISLKKGKNMHNENGMIDSEYQMELNALKSDINLLRKHIFIDDISMAKNPLWIFKQKLKNNETFSDFGFLVSIKISDYAKIVKEYDSNVGNRLLKQVSDYMIRYMEDNNLNYEIVRYKKGNFLIFMHDLNEDEVEEHIVNMQNGMLNYKFKHRSRMFQLGCYSAVMQYIENESFSSVLDQLDEKLFQNKK